MNIIETIKAEVERQYDLNFAKATEWESKAEDRHSYGVWYEGKVQMCKEFLSFLDTIEEPKIVDGEDETELNSLAYLEQLGYTCIPPNSGHSEKPNNHLEGLDEAAMEIPMMASAGRILDEQFQDEPDEIRQTFLRSWRGGFKAGAEWRREQMMKEAVEGIAVINANAKTDGFGYVRSDYLPDDFLRGLGNFRLIIVKEDAE